MCGRFANFTEPKKMAKVFGICHPFSLEPSYNIAPTENISVVCTSEDGEPIVKRMRWGLIPSWEVKPRVTPLINARVETIDVKPAFKDAVQTRRCLIVANGFFEWKTNIVEKQIVKQPYYVHHKDDELLAFAGVWETWRNEDKMIESCCIITTPASREDLFLLHHRLPAIIKKEDYSDWLDNLNNGWPEVRDLVTREPQDDIIFHAVTQKANRAKYKGEDCVLPVNLV